MTRRDDEGNLEAADGWQIDWDIRDLPHRVDVFNTEGVPQWRTSGNIGQRHLSKMIASFLVDHAGEQLELL